MKEKKKGRDYPFAEYLHQDEHILWIHEAPVSRLPSMITLYYSAALIGLCLWVIVPHQSRNIYQTCASSFGCSMFILMMGLVVQLTDLKAPPRSNYALTNKNIFRWVGNQVIKISLKELPPIGFVRGVGSQGTLTFGDNLLSISNIEDAAYVKTMIEQARRRRLEEEHS